MNKNNSITLRARKGKEWLLKKLEDEAKERERSVNYLVFEIVESHYSNGKPKTKKK